MGSNLGTGEKIGENIIGSRVAKDSGDQGYILWRFICDRVIAARHEPGTWRRKQEPPSDRKELLLERLFPFLAHGGREYDGECDHCE